MHRDRSINLPRAIVIAGWVSLVLLICLTAGCVGVGTDWERSAAQQVQRGLEIAESNTREIAGLASAANDEAVMAVLSDLESDFAQYSARHPEATPQELKQWMAEAVSLGASTLSARMQAGERLRDQCDIAYDNLRQARQISQQHQAVIEAQLAFGERWKVAATKIGESIDDAAKRSAARRQFLADERKARQQALREQFFGGLQAAGINVPSIIRAPATQPSR